MKIEGGHQMSLNYFDNKCMSILVVLQAFLLEMCHFCDGELFSPWWHLLLLQINLF